MILAAGSRHVSLDAPMVDGEEGSLKDVLAIDSPAADEEILRSSLNSAMDDCLAKLHPREREVIELSFGIGRDNPMKLEDIADEFELTRERIRQIRDRALRKLRNSPGRKHLVAYLG